MADDDFVVKFMQRVEETGALDDERCLDLLLGLHDMLRYFGADPESPATYRAILACSSIIMGAKGDTQFAQVAAEQLTLLSMRALRDLRERGGG